MLDTTRAIGAGELSLATPAACTAASPSSAAAAAILHGSPVESEGTEFFDAYDTLPWSPERAVPTRQSPAAVAARRMQLALWPDTEELAELAVAEKPRREREVFNGINSSAPNVVEPKVKVGGPCGWSLACGWDRESEAALARVSHPRRRGGSTGLDLDGGSLMQLDP